MAALKRWPGSLSLNAKDLRAVRLALRRRRELLRELHAVSLKFLAGKYGVSARTITEIDRHLHCFHEREPLCIPRSVESEDSVAA